MSVTRETHKRSLAFTVALAIVFTLAIPFAGIAIATHETHTLEVTEETATNPTGTFHTLTAVLNAAPTNHAQQVDFEIDCTSGCSGATYTLLAGHQGGAVTAAEAGGPVSAVDTPTDGDQTPGTTDDTRTSPELSCSVPVGDTNCQVSYSRNNLGDELIAAWIDTDATTSGNATDNSDQAEGRDEAAAGGAGNVGEPDHTDVVQKSWFSAAAGTIVLDCDDADADTANDRTTNAPGQPETYTCRAIDMKGTASTADDTAVSGQVIDGEMIDTGAPGATGDSANDPDNGAVTPPDFTCTTGADGTCQVTVTAAQNETGDAEICFWIDQDNDNGVDLGGSEFDGGECDEEDDAGLSDVNDDENPTETSNQTDVVEKTWAAPTPTILDATPEHDSNVKGSSHTVTATVTDQFGNPSQGAAVDFDITGPNAASSCQNVLTNASGVATCTYTDSTTVTGPEPETDTINVHVDPADLAEGIDDDDNDLTDVVDKFWFTTIPTPNNLVLDMTAADDCNDAADSTDDNAVETNHEVCGTVYAGPGATNPIAGANVTLTISGQGYWTQTGGTATRADDPNLGQTITVTSGANGVFRALMTSLTTGTSTVTATSGSATDTGTKTWTALADGARTLDCDPETGTNPPGSTHVITCTARDRLGNPVANEAVNVQETGPGRISSPAAGNCVAGDNTFVGTACGTTNANGELEIIVSSTVNETGTQTVLAALNDDDDDLTPLVRDAAEQQDECDRIAGDPAVSGQSPAGPAGQCADEVTKTWRVGELAECEDGVDNDGDGLIDFPDDPGCDSAADDDERDFDVPEECTGEGIIAGTDGADVLNGTAGDDVICGFGGNDTLNGLGGNDVLLGGGGDDELNGGDGADSIEADVVAACLQTGCADGNDTADGGGGKDTIRGHGGNDLLLGGNKNDLMVGGQGNDTIRGQNGWDTIRGNAGDDRLIGNAGNDILQGGTGNDLAQGGGGNDTIRGFTGRDNLRGGGGADIIKGGSGRDQLRGGRGPDILDGGAGRDACFGGPGDDTLRRCE